MNQFLNNTIVSLAKGTAGKRFGTVLADPPWRFVNRTGKVAPEHRRLARYQTMTEFGEDLVHVRLDPLSQ